MERLKLIFTSLSLLLVTLCLAACLYFVFALPADSSDLLTFRVMALIFAVAMVWFAFNVYGLIKSNKQ